MKSIKKILFSFALLIFLSFSIENKSNYIPDEKTAISIAEAIWLPIYGENIEKQKPFKAVLQGDTAWHVFGTMPQSDWKLNSNGDSILFMHTGGVAYLIISKSDGKIWHVSHGK